MFDFPNTPLNGQTVSGSNGATWLWDGTKWVASTQPGGGGGNTQISVSDTPPTAPAHGALWWDSVGGQLYIYYADPDSSEWVQANTLAGLGAFLSLAGGTMTGPITLAGDPNAALQASTKQYVDTNVGHNVGRNLLHNGMFNVAQRGAGPWTTNNVFTLDRWKFIFNLDTASLAQTALSDTARSQIGDEAARNCIGNTFTGNAGAASFTYIQQAIEGVARLAGKTVTVSFWANGSAAQKVGINIAQGFGTGGSPSAGLWVLATGMSITTLAGQAWSRFSVTIPIPSIAGKTLGTNGDDATQLVLWYSSGATSGANAGNVGVQSGVIGIWGVQLEVGSVATPLEHPDLQQDIAKCQRFYQTGALLYGGYATAAVPLYGSSLFPVVMRATPTIAQASGNTITNISNFLLGSSPFSCWVNGTATATGAWSMLVNFTASADL